MIVAATVTFADKSDPQSAPATLCLAEANLVLAGSETEIAEVVMDKGCHDNGWLVALADRGVRTYRAAAKDPALDQQTRSIRSGLPGQPPACAREQGAAVESLA